ncbi:MAG: EI24 domain-containing protein [Alphaproteobacteria bacterium]
MLRDIERVIVQFRDPVLWRIVFKGIAATAVLLVATVAGLAVVVDVLVATGIAWLDPVLPWLTGLGGIVAAVFLSPVVTVAVLGLFVDEVAQRVEAVNYPELPPAKPAGLLTGLLLTLKLLAVTLALNLIALPLYLILPGLNLVIFLALNGYLLSREYVEAVAQRRMAPKEITRLRRSHRGRFLVAGVVLAGLALVPVANLLLPVAGTALMVHRLTGLRGRPDAVAS